MARPRRGGRLDHRRHGGPGRPRDRAPRSRARRAAARARPRRRRRSRWPPSGWRRSARACVLRCADFRQLATEAAACGIEAAHAVLLDLGLSSYQLAHSGRGFSFQADEPLDMRFDVRQSLTAAELLRTTPEPELAQLLTTYGEEPAARRIARRVAAARARAPHRHHARAGRAGVVGDPAPPPAPPASTPRPGRSRRSASRSTTSWAASRRPCRRARGCSRHAAGSA